MLLIAMGISMSFIGFDPGGSFWDNFQAMVIDFRSPAFFLVSLLMLIFKVGFIIMGYFSLKYRGKVLRAKLDDKGFYYKEITGSSKMERVAFDLNPFVFVPYSAITNIAYTESFWKGDALEIETLAGRKKLVTLNVLSRKEKREIYDILKERMNKGAGNGKPGGSKNKNFVIL
ncbi:YdbT family protein [Niabella soli]|nr:hypothetical protein [Niabella soli]